MITIHPRLPNPQIPPFPNHQYVLADKFIVRIDIFCSNLTNIFINNEKNVHIRKNGSLNVLSIREVIEFTKQRVLQDPSNILVNPHSLNFNPKLLQKLDGEDRVRIHSTIGLLLDNLSA